VEYAKIKQALVMAVCNADLPMPLRQQAQNILTVIF